MNMKVFALVIQLVVLYMVIPQASLFFGDVMKAVDDVVKGLCKVSVLCNSYSI